MSDERVRRTSREKVLLTFVLSVCWVAISWVLEFFVSFPASEILILIGFLVVFYLAITIWFPRTGARQPDLILNRSAFPPCGGSCHPSRRRRMTEGGIVT